MGRIHILSDQVANQIAAGEVVDRPASVVKELMENALDAGAARIRIEIEGGGRKLIRISDDGCGMLKDDALLAFERHATSKLRVSDDLLSISTLGFRGEALPSIASVSRLEMKTKTAKDLSGVLVEIAGGKVLNFEETGAPPGTSIAVRDLFFNTPARRKFLKSENTELAHITALVTHYALAHPEKHFELHTPAHSVLITPPVERSAERIFQIFGKDTLDQLLPLAAELDLERVGLPEPPPWKRDADYEPPVPGVLRISGFASKPELQKLNRNSIYCFVNRRLVRDRVLMHAVSEAYRNILPPTSYPVMLLFLDLPPEEVDVNVHPAKTEVRFRQSSLIHDFVRDSIRNKLTVARPAAGFLQALVSYPNASSALVPDLSPSLGEEDSNPESDAPPSRSQADAFLLTPRPATPVPGSLHFPDQTGSRIDAPIAAPNIAAAANDVVPVPSGRNETDAAADVTLREAAATVAVPPAASSNAGCSHSGLPDADADGGQPTLDGLASLKPLGQLRDSFILAVNAEGLWIVDQHVAHERILFERVLRQRTVEQVQRQQLLMPMLLDLLPAQMVAFAGIARELTENGFEVEPFGPRTLAVKAAPAGLEGQQLEQMLVEVLEQAGSPNEAKDQAKNLEALRTRIAASIACHAAIKINTPLDLPRMEWLLSELAKTAHPTSCPHGRPIVLRYAWKDIQRAFQRI